MIDIDNSHFDYAEVNHGSEPIAVPNFVDILPVIPNCVDYQCKMQEIISGVFLGPYAAATKTRLHNLMKHGITHIICVRQELEAPYVRPQFMNRFKYLILDIVDSANENIIPHFSKVRQFIEECLSLGGKVLIHGYYGISRSAALVLAYAMQKLGISYRQAYTLVKTRRHCIKPNEGFVAQLLEFEPIYRAQQTLHHGQSSTCNQSKKRKSEQLDVETEMLPLPPPPSPVSEVDIMEYLT